MAEVQTKELSCGTRINRNSYVQVIQQPALQVTVTPNPLSPSSWASSTLQASGYRASLAAMPLAPVLPRWCCSRCPGLLVCFWHCTLAPWQPYFCLGQNDIICICLKTVLQKADKIHTRKKFMPGLKVKHDLAKQQRRGHSGLRFRKSHPKFSQQAVFSPVTQL